MLLGHVFFLLFVELTSAQIHTCVNASQVDHDNRFPFVSALFPELSFQPPHGKPSLGHTNLTYICAVAVDEWLRNNCTDTADIRIERRILGKGVQFPCAASYVGNAVGAPLVQVTYGWTRTHVSGWELSSASNINSWAQLLVSYILPSVVFSFSIPRPYELRISWRHSHIDLTFSRKLLLKFVVSLIRLLIAAISISVDTVLWLFFAFAFAAPILFSGLYEARQDQRLIYYLERKNVRGILPAVMIAKALFAILCGNLNIATAWDSTMALTKPLKGYNTAGKVQNLPKRTLAATANRHLTHQAGNYVASDLEVEKLMLNCQSSNNENSEAEISYPSQVSRTTPFCVVNKSNSWPQDELNRKTDRLMAVSEIPDPSKSDSNKSLFLARTTLTNQLKAMLACQSPFGAIIGGPVIFYLGGFIYALLVLKAYLGNEDLSEALAFGMWWMIIPHIAAVSMLLLAGNNPNILEGYAPPPPEDGQVHVGNRPKCRFTFREKVYRSRFIPAWIQQRGASKQHWLLLVFASSWSDHDHVWNSEETCTICEELKHFLTDAVILKKRDWIGCLGIAFILFTVPCLFGYITAYFTPKVGIACRALTFLVYWCTQVALLALWACYVTWKDEFWVLGRKIRESFKPDAKHEMDTKHLVAELERKAEFHFNIQIPGTRNVSMAKAKKPSVAKARLRMFILALGWILGIIAFGGALFSSCAGSIMQVMGVYRNCLCQMNVSDMRSSNLDKVFITLSTNLTEAIHNAEEYWIPMGAVSTAFLGVVCYAGWWYQTQFRERFYEVADALGLEDA